MKVAGSTTAKGLGTADGDANDHRGTEFLKSGVDRAVTIDIHGPWHMHARRAERLDLISEY